MDNFKQASKLGLRFQTSKGSLSVEQLWHLSMTELATYIKTARKVLKQSEDADDLAFLDNKSIVDSTDQLRFDILKDVYLSKKADNDAVKSAREKKEHNQKIIELIAEKKEGALKTKTIEELEAMLQD